MSDYPQPEPASPCEVEIERDRIREIATRFPTAAQPLDQVVPSLVGLAVAEAAFTSFTYSLAVAYNEVEAFTIAELRRVTDDTTRIQDGVAVSAATWQHAEDASRVRAV
ncbi:MULTISPECIES: hypothetical protein [Streptosporangium]|uniref:Uncharacterized protein n=1 Tax=Streptosporangium brasiliense TaxID=47480 RepID=A0ABT9RDI2_9ACTN|nr:hypothetical protein [Streptosporangium brasiliense]MDP9866931.1 hypothetical protein [Streptosporangium brasiliense]